MMQIPLKHKYRVYRGFVKRGGQVGNGDSGQHKRHKLPEKVKRLLPPQPRITLYIDKNGNRHWIREF